MYIEDSSVARDDDSLLSVDIVLLLAIQEIGATSTLSSSIIVIILEMWKMLMHSDKLALL